MQLFGFNTQPFRWRQSFRLLGPVFFEITLALVFHGKRIAQLELLRPECAKNMAAGTRLSAGHTTGAVRSRLIPLLRIQTYVPASYIYRLNAESRVPTTPLCRRALVLDLRQQALDFVLALQRRKTILD